MPLGLPPGYHGPLVVALDSNIHIESRQHGYGLLNGEAPNEGDAYEQELVALDTLINIWLLCDVRLIANPQARVDANRVTEPFLAASVPAINALAESLAFQSGDWTVPVPSDREGLASGGDVNGLPEVADRDLVAEAQAVEAHVFLSRDRAVLDRAPVSGPRPDTMAPTALAAEMAYGDLQVLAGGICQSEACPYESLRAPGPDIGKWNGLFSIFGGE